MLYCFREFIIQNVACVVTWCCFKLPFPNSAFFFFSCVSCETFTDTSVYLLHFNACLWLRSHMFFLYNNCSWTILSRTRIISTVLKMWVVQSTLGQFPPWSGKLKWYGFFLWWVIKMKWGAYLCFPQMKSVPRNTWNGLMLVLINMEKSIPWKWVKLITVMWPLQRSKFRVIARV